MMKPALTFILLTALLIPALPQTAEAQFRRERAEDSAMERAAKEAEERRRREAQAAAARERERTLQIEQNELNFIADKVSIHFPDVPREGLKADIKLIRDTHLARIRGMSPQNQRAYLTSELDKINSKYVNNEGEGQNYFVSFEQYKKDHISRGAIGRILDSVIERGELPETRNVETESDRGRGREEVPSLHRTIQPKPSSRPGEVESSHEDTTGTGAGDGYGETETNSDDAEVWDGPRSRH